MTIGVNNRNDAIGNDTADTFPYGFKIFAATDLEVKVRDAAGVETTLTYLTHYTVTGVGVKAGGNVALVNGAFAWLDGDGDLASGYAMTIRRVRPLTQSTDIRNQGGFFADAHEDTFDHLMMVDQQQQDEIDRSLKIATTEDGSLSATVVPAAAQRANRVLGFNSGGDVEMLAVTTQVYGVRESLHVSAAGQTLFNLAFAYVTGVNALAVYVNGLRMVPGIDYVETSSMSFTMLYPLALNDRVAAYAGQDTTGLGATLASLCTYILAIAGAISRNVQDWIRERPISVKDVGAVGDGVTSDSSSLSAAFNAANGREIFVPSGQFLSPVPIVVDGALQAGYDGMTVKGQGWDWTRRSTGGSELIFSGAVGPLMKVQGNPALVHLNQVSIADLSLRATNAALVGAMFRLCHVANVTFKNCNFEANSAGTLLEGDNLITVTFERCRFYKAAIGVITQAIGGFGGAYANVIRFKHCWFDKLAKSTDFTYAGRTVVFEQCVWEPTEAGAASPNLVGGHDATFSECWFGDANGGGTWITATGEKVYVRGCDITSGAIAVDMSTSFGGIVEGGNLSGTTCAVKLNATRKGKVIGARIILTANNSVGVDVTAGVQHVVEDNDVVESGAPAGTIAYRLAAATTGTLRERKTNGADTIITNNAAAGAWTLETESLRKVVSIENISSRDPGNILAGTVGEFTTAVVGAEVGDAVVAVPPVGLNVGLIHCHFVSAADVVTTRLFNGTAGAIDPAAANWRYRILKATI